MSGSEYVYLVPWMLKTRVGPTPPWEIGDGNDAKVLESFQQAFVVNLGNGKRHLFGNRKDKMRIFIDNIIMHTFRIAIKAIIFKKVSFNCGKKNICSNTN